MENKNEYRARIQEASNDLALAVLMAEALAAGYSFGVPHTLDHETALIHNISELLDSVEHHMVEAKTII